VQTGIIQMANPYKVGIELAMASNHAQVLGALSGSLLNIHPQIDRLIGHFGRLKLAITGALGVGAGTEIFRGLEQFIEKTKELRVSTRKVKCVGVTAIAPVL
jgi:hypothetical protein